MTNHLSEENVLKAVAKANKEQKDLVDEYHATCKALKESDEKPRWSQCNDCFDDDHNKCSGGSCACSLVHPEHHPMQHESKPQDWQDGLKEALAAPNDAKHWYDYQCRVFDEIRSLLDSRYQEGVKAGEKRALEWVLKDVDLSSSSVEQIANRLDTPENQ